MTETREGWLIKAAQILSEWLGEIGEQVPEIHVSVGFPGGTANRKTTVGQCWISESSADGACQIFISPIRGEDDTVDVLGTLLHELIHAVDDCESGHRGNFARIAKQLGFVPKLTQSGNRNEELEERLKGLAERLGPFPHATLSTTLRAADAPPKQGTRMLKVTCFHDPEYKLRMTRKMIDEHGLPLCPCHNEPMEEA